MKDDLELLPAKGALLVFAVLGAVWAGYELFEVAVNFALRNLLP
jgi:hypothetical protein